MKQNLLKRAMALVGGIVLATGVGQSQLLIDQTYIKGGSDLYSPMNIDNTGVISRRTNFGGRLNYSDGAYFRGIVQNGKRKSGTVYFPDGRVQSCYDYDGNGKFNGQAAMEWPNGTWYVGYFSHGNKHGKGSSCVRSSGSKIYYDEVWSNGSCQRRTRVSRPSMNITDWNPPVEVPVTGSSQKSKESSRQSYSDCPYCKGTGQVATNTSVGTYGLRTGKRKCPTCGEWIMSGIAHSHSTCKHCGGSGHMR